MKKREADFTTKFRHWLKVYFTGNSTAFELKQTRNDSIAFNAVKDHQIDALRAVKKTFSYKIPDDSRGVKPFDLFYMNKANGIVVIKYPKVFVLIDVDDFVAERDQSERKSLTAKRACQIGKYINL